MNLITKHGVNPKVPGNVMANDLVLLYMYDILTLGMQVGMQPIHSAASSGQPEVILLLTQEFGVNPDEKADVCIQL